MNIPNTVVRVAQLEAQLAAKERELSESKARYDELRHRITGVRLEIEQIHLVIEWIIAVGVVSALKGAGKLDFFERVNGQNL